MNSSVIWKKSYIAKAAMASAAVCIAAVLPLLSGLPAPTQAQAIILLSSPVIVPAEQDRSPAAENPENSQIAAVPQLPSLNTAGEGSLPRWRTVRMRVTAYCACPLCCGPLACGRTANNYVIRQGDHFVAAPKEYSFGTEVIVPQYNRDKPIKVLDRGGAIKGNRLDVFFPSHTQAAKWGIKYLNVKVRMGELKESDN